MVMCKLDKPAGTLSFLLETLETSGGVPSWASFEKLSPVAPKLRLQYWRHWRQSGDKTETFLKAKLYRSGDKVETDTKANIYLSSFSCLQCIHKKHKSLAEEAKSINKRVVFKRVRKGQCANQERR